MLLYFIGYDLKKPVKDYPRLWAALRDLGAKPLLKSEWSLRSTSTLEVVFKYFSQFVDSDDALVVTLVNRAMAENTVTPIQTV